MYPSLDCLSSSKEYRIHVLRFAKKNHECVSQLLHNSKICIIILSDCFVSVAGGEFCSIKNGVNLVNWNTFICYKNGKYNLRVLGTYVCMCTNLHVYKRGENTI